MKYFFSYSRTDADFVLKLATDLKKQDLDVWLDQLDIIPGSRWDDAVEQALNESECMLVTLSETSVKSQNVLDEVSYAIKKGKRVIPLLIENCEVPFRIARFQLIDFTKNYSAGLDLLTRTLKAVDKNKDANVSHESHLGQVAIDSIPEKKEEKKRNIKPGIYIFLALLFAIAGWFVINNSSKEKNNFSQSTKMDSTSEVVPTDSADGSQKGENNSIDTTKKTPGRPQDEEGGNAGTIKDRPIRTIPINPEILSAIITKNPVVDDGKNKIVYRVANDYVTFQITSEESPSIKIDVNQNALIDANYDRAYGLTRDKSICVQYLIRSGASSTCGAPPSRARLAITRSSYTFSIPVQEIRSNRNSSTVSVQFEFTNLRTLQRTFYPARTDYVDFTKVYKIKVDQGD